jgi:hypothetical protein
MLKVIQALKGEYVTGAAKMHTIYPLPYLKGASIGYMACLLAGAEGDNLEHTPHSYHCHLTCSGGCNHISVFNTFLQDHLETNTYAVKDDVQLPFTYESPTILDLMDDESDHVVLASLTASIATKFQALQKNAVDKLSAFSSNKFNMTPPVTAPLLLEEDPNNQEEGDDDDDDRKKMPAVPTTNNFAPSDLSFEVATCTLAGGSLEHAASSITKPLALPAQELPKSIPKKNPKYLDLDIRNPKNKHNTNKIIVTIKLLLFSKQNSFFLLLFPIYLSPACKRN